MFVPAFTSFVSFSKNTNSGPVGKLFVPRKAANCVKIRIVCFARHRRIQLQEVGPWQRQIAIPRSDEAAEIWLNVLSYGLPNVTLRLTPEELRKVNGAFVAEWLEVCRTFPLYARRIEWSQLLVTMPFLLKIPRLFCFAAS